MLYSHLPIKIEVESMQTEKMTETVSDAYQAFTCDLETAV